MHHKLFSALRPFTFQFIYFLLVNPRGIACDKRDSIALNRKEGIVKTPLEFRVINVFPSVVSWSVLPVSLEPRSAMRAYAAIVCLLLILYHVQAAPRPCRNRRDVSEKKSDHKTENKAEEQHKSEDSEGKEKKDKKQYVPYAPAMSAVPAYNMGDVICEDSQPVQVVQIRDLSIANGVIKSSNIVQM